MSEYILNFLVMFLLFSNNTALCYKHVFSYVKYIVDPWHSNYNYSSVIIIANPDFNHEVPCQIWLMIFFKCKKIQCLHLLVENSYTISRILYTE